ncbi:MAG TPA: hypothetical protein VFX18_01985 [Candidatus Nitrosocosmicus sp.]|nr:hypothetical protein [Candidatus Nitrosocosmicus sp.]
MGLTQGKTPKQKYFCYACRSHFTGPYDPSNPFTMNSSNIIEGESD